MLKYIVVIFCIFGFCLFWIPSIVRAGYIPPRLSIFIWRYIQHTTCCNSERKLCTSRISSLHTLSSWISLNPSVLRKPFWAIPYSFWYCIRVSLGTLSWMCHRFSNICLSLWLGSCHRHISELLKCDICSNTLEQLWSYCITAFKCHNFLFPCGKF